MIALSWTLPMFLLLGLSVTLITLLSCLQKRNQRKIRHPQKPKKSVESTSADSKISELDQKWSERFNRLEALIMSKSFQPSFTSDVRVTPTPSPPASVSKDSEPFFQPTHWPVDTSPVKHTGPDTHAAMQPSAGKLKPDKDSSRTGTCRAHWPRGLCC